jgi:hypothetical protein
MIRKEDCRINMPVLFGRPNGEKTPGIIVKLNDKKAKVKTTEARGSRTSAGEEWGVPYSLLYLPDGTSSAAPAPLPKTEAPKYNPFQPAEDVLILQAIGIVYNHLSPENLACDGEASQAHIARTRAECNRKLKGLFLALGREVDETQVYEWDRQRQKALQQRA